MAYPGPAPWFKDCLNKPRKKEDIIRVHTWTRFTLSFSHSPFVYTCKYCGVVVYHDELKRMDMQPFDRNLDLMVNLLNRESDEGKEEVCPRL